MKRRGRRPRPLLRRSGRRFAGLRAATIERAKLVLAPPRGRGPRRRRSSPSEVLYAPKLAEQKGAGIGGGSGKPLLTARIRTCNPPRRRPSA